jgi:putative flavoprotein involved in K+ transport
LQLWDVVVIGAGQAGLAAGYYLNKTSLNYTLVEAGPAVGGSWQHYWHSVRLFSPARYSSLPGMSYSMPADAYPGRDEVIDYLRGYAAFFKIPVILNSPVERVEKIDDLFYINITSGNVLRTPQLIVATGPFNTPYVPEISGHEEFQGRVLHSYNYTEPSSFADERVVVVGANNSAVQIGVELAQVADVSLATRRPIHWAPKYVLGKNVFFWLHDTGYDMIPLGYFYDIMDTDRVIDDGTYRTAVEAGCPNVKPMFTAFTENGVVWPDGMREPVDTIVFATGYRKNNMPFLEETGALNDEGMPLERGGVSTTVDGLYYVGLFGQRTAASATLRGVGADARSIVRRAKRYARKYRRAARAAPR